LTRLVGLKYHPCYLVSGVLPTLFSVEPKESLQDLFDREDEVIILTPCPPNFAKYL